MDKMHGNVESFICVMDMNSLNYENVDFRLATHHMSMLEKNYPETVYKFYILNNHWLTL